MSFSDGSSVRKNRAGLIVSDFPLLNWLIIPVCGYLFGWLLLRVKDKKRFYLSFSPALLAAAVIVMAFEIRYEFGMFAEGENAYYHLYTYDALWFLALTAGLLGVWYGSSKMLPKKIIGFLPIPAVISQIFTASIGCLSVSLRMWRSSFCLARRSSLSMLSCF
jgi:ACR3 family arsenite efflux pump ArsB